VPQSPRYPPLTVLQLTGEHQYATNSATTRSSLLAAAARQLRLDCIMVCCAVELNACTACKAEVFVQVLNWVPNSRASDIL
jgi:hypothetical protein